MYIPDPEIAMESLHEIAEIYFEKLCPGTEFADTRKLVYDFYSYRGNLEAIFDFLLFSDYSPRKLHSNTDVDECKRIHFTEDTADDPYLGIVIKTSEYDTEHFYVELRHPYFQRAQPLRDLQSALYNEQYFVVDSFPDFFEQFLKLYHKG